MAFVTYVLVSLSSGKLYIGQTNNLEQRLNRHNRNLNKATKNRGPWKVFFAAPFTSRAEAVALEKKLNPKNSYEFFARRADELQNSVKQHVMHKIQDESKIKHDPNLRVKYFALIRVNPDVIN